MTNQRERLREAINYHLLVTWLTSLPYSHTEQLMNEWDAAQERIRVLELATVNDPNEQSLLDEYYNGLDRIKELQERILELEEALQSIANNTCCDRCQEAALVARAALAKAKP